MSDIHTEWRLHCIWNQKNVRKHDIDPFDDTSSHFGEVFPLMSWSSPLQCVCRKFCPCVPGRVRRFHSHRIFFRLGEFRDVFQKMNRFWYLHVTQRYQTLWRSARYLSRTKDILSGAQYCAKWGRNTTDCVSLLRNSATPSWRRSALRGRNTIYYSRSLLKKCNTVTTESGTRRAGTKYDLSYNLGLYWWGSHGKQRGTNIRKTYEGC